MTPLPICEPLHLVFTDLDGSLLDHDSYSAADAQPAVDLLDALGIPLIYASSKTRAEIELLRRQLDNRHPFIVENGAAICIPVGYFAQQPAGTQQRDGLWVHELARPRAVWTRLLEQLSDRFPGQFDYFNRAGPEGIAAMTGLAPRQAALANAREYSEPVKWLGDEANRTTFLAACQDAGARVLRGGRFYNVASDCDKGRALTWLREQFALATGFEHICDLAAGDGENDVPMLLQAETALLVRAPQRSFPALVRTTGVIHSDLVGPAGWAEGVTAWLYQQGLLVQER